MLRSKNTFVNEEQPEKDLEAIEDYFLQMAPDMYDPTIREILYRNYCIVYYVPKSETDPIEILTVFHSSKQFGEK